jgi:hypothetical protein
MPQNRSQGGRGQEAFCREDDGRFTECDDEGGSRTRGRARSEDSEQVGSTRFGREGRRSSYAYEDDRGRSTGPAAVGAAA